MAKDDEGSQHSRSPLSDHLELVVDGRTVSVRPTGQAKAMIHALARTGELHAMSPTDMVFMGTAWATAGLEIIHRGGGGGVVLEATINAGKQLGAGMANAVFDAAKESAQ